MAPYFFYAIMADGPIVEMRIPSCWSRFRKFEQWEPPQRKTKA